MRGVRRGCFPFPHAPKVAIPQAWPKVQTTHHPWSDTVIPLQFSVLYYCRCNLPVLWYRDGGTSPVLWSILDVYIQYSLIPFRPTSRCTDILLFRFLEGLVMLRSDRCQISSNYRTVCLVHCKKKYFWKLFITFVLIVVLVYLSYFHVKNVFWTHFMICYEQLFIFFNIANHKRLLRENIRRKKLRKNLLWIFSNSVFSRFFQDFFTHMTLYLSKYYRYLKNLNWCAPGTWGQGYKHCLQDTFVPVHCKKSIKSFKNRC